MDTLAEYAGVPFVENKSEAEIFHAKVLLLPKHVHPYIFEQRASRGIIQLRAAVAAILF